MREVLLQPRAMAMLLHTTKWKAAVFGQRKGVFVDGELDVFYGAADITADNLDEFNAVKKVALETLLDAGAVILKR